MTDHSACAVKQEVEFGVTYETHECPPCPDGLVCGREYRLYDDPVLNERIRAQALRSLDALCESSHSERTAAIGGP